MVSIVGTSDFMEHTHQGDLKRQFPFTTVSSLFVKVMVSYLDVSSYNPLFIVHSYNSSNRITFITAVKQCKVAWLLY